MEVRKILAVRNDRFGEFLLNIPAFRALKQTFLQAKLTLVVNPSVQELAKYVEYVDEVIVWENKKHKIGEIIAFSSELRKKKFDLCVIFNPSKEFNLISFLARIPIRVGYARKWGFLLTHKMPDLKYLGEKHEVEYNLELVNLIGAKTEDKKLSLNVRDDIIDALVKGMNTDNSVAVHPWTSDPVKQWPQQYFHLLIQRLTLELDLKVVIIGGKDELAKNIKFSSSVSGALIDLTGRTTLIQLAALLKRCKLLISGDSGPLHLASCVETPVVAIFRSDMPEKKCCQVGSFKQG